MSFQSGYIINVEGDSDDEEIERREFPYSEFDNFERNLKNKLCFHFLISDEMSTTLPKNIRLSIANTYHYHQFLYKTINVIDVTRLSRRNKMNLVISVYSNLLPKPNKYNFYKLTTHENRSENMPQYFINWEQLFLLYCLDQKSLHNCYF
jgi:hypothetical protein